VQPGGHRPQTAQQRVLTQLGTRRRKKVFTTRAGPQCPEGTALKLLGTSLLLLPSLRMKERRQYISQQLGTMLSGIQLDLRREKLGLPDKSR